MPRQQQQQASKQATAYHNIAYQLHDNDSTTTIDRKSLFGVHAQVSLKINKKSMPEPAGAGRGRPEGGNH